MKGRKTGREKGREGRQVKKEEMEELRKRWATKR